jgi:hypothetical protein
MMLGVDCRRLRNPSAEMTNSPRLWGQWQSQETRAEQLLREWLTPSQASQYESCRFFDVVGCDTGKRYRIYRGRAMNIGELDAKGDIALQWCALPEGALAVGDIMLAQKIALEEFETEVLAIARGSQESGSLGTIFCQFSALVLMMVLFAMLIWTCAPT